MTRAILCLAAFLGATTAARADLATLPPEAQARYKAESARARAAAKAGRRDEALAAWQAALAAAPNDARALSELAALALAAKDAPRAEEWSRRAVAAATEPPLKAASLYNLGRALALRGDSAGAKSAYEQSLALRPNDTVRARVVAPGGAPGPKTPEAVKSVAAWCKRLTAESEAALAEPEWSVTVDCGERYTKKAVKGPLTLAAPPAPIVGAELVAVHEQTNDGNGETEDARLFVAVKTARGLFVLGPVATASAGHRGSASVGAIALEPVDAGAGVGAIQIRARTLTAGHDGDEQSEDEAQTLAIAGVGPSGVPSLVGPFVVAESGASAPIGRTLKRRTTFAVDTAIEGGALVVRAKSGKPGQGGELERARPGTIPLKFP